MYAARNFMHILKTTTEKKYTHQTEDKTHKHHPIIVYGSGCCLVIIFFWNI